MEPTNFKNVNYWIKAAERDFEIVEELFRKKETGWIYFKLSDFLTKVIAVRSLYTGKNPEEIIESFHDYFLSSGIKLSDREMEVLEYLDSIKEAENPTKTLKLIETQYDEAEMISQIAAKLIEKFKN